MRYHETMENIVCIKYPHLFKPLQSINAILLIISLGSASAVDGSGVLWFITLTSLFISVVATILFMLDKNEPILINLSGGLVTWNVVEFVYSTILTVLCAISIWLSFGYANHVKQGEHSAGYVFAGIFMILQTAFYAIPSVLIYEKVKFRQDLNDQIHFAEEESVPYQNAPIPNV